MSGTPTEHDREARGALLRSITAAIEERGLPAPEDITLSGRGFGLQMATGPEGDPLADILAWHAALGAEERLTMFSWPGDNIIVRTALGLAGLTVPAIQALSASGAGIVRRLRPDVLYSDGLRFSAAGIELLVEEMRATA